MSVRSIALMIYSKVGMEKSVFMDEKYTDLANAFINAGFNVKSVMYNDESAENLAISLTEFDAVLVWVNPIQQGRSRKILDSLLMNISEKGCLVSAHPEVILKIGTKDVLYKTREMDWGGDIQMYTNFSDFQSRFFDSLQKSGTRVLKQYRGNGGNGVFKISYQQKQNKVSVIHARTAKEEKLLSPDELCHEFESYFSNNGLLIDQEWNNNIMNGTVRCYMTGTKVTGFGYQEINALYHIEINSVLTHIPPSKRYYFTENCGMFRDLREIMENDWIPQLLELQSVKHQMMPVIWDADFFINTPNSSRPKGKYQLCETNVSCVSPYPPSSIPYIVEEVKNRLEI